MSKLLFLQDVEKQESALPIGLGLPASSSSSSSSKLDVLLVTTAQESKFGTSIASDIHITDTQTKQVVHCTLSKIFLFLLVPQVLALIIIIIIIITKKNKNEMTNITTTTTTTTTHTGTQISLGPLSDNTKAFTEISSHLRRGEFLSSDGQIQYEWSHRALASACHSMLCIEQTTQWYLQTRQVGLVLGPFVGRVTPNEAIIFLEAACSGPIVCRAVDIESLHAVHRHAFIKSRRPQFVRMDGLKPGRSYIITIFGASNRSGEDPIHAHVHTPFNTVTSLQIAVATYVFSSVVFERDVRARSARISIFLIHLLNSYALTRIHTHTHTHTGTATSMSIKKSNS